MEETRRAPSPFRPVRTQHTPDTLGTASAPADLERIPTEAQPREGRGPQAGGTLVTRGRLMAEAWQVDWPRRPLAVGVQEVPESCP